MPWRSCKHCAITVSVRSRNKENGRTDPTARDDGLRSRLRVRSRDLSAEKVALQRYPIGVCDAVTPVEMS